MKKIVFSSWITGFKKISLRKMLVEKAALDSKEALDCVNKLLAGEEVVICLNNDAIADEFKNEARLSGVVIQGDNDKEEREFQYLKEHSIPCPYCGKYLRVKTAKQCSHCLMNWHDENQPYKMK